MGKKGKGATADPRKSSSTKTKRRDRGTLIQGRHLALLRKGERVLEKVA